jgi:hypothetical protein
MAQPDDRASTLKRLERALSKPVGALAKAPERLEDLRRVLREFKASPPGRLSASSQQTLKQLFDWQLDLKRAGYIANIEALNTAATLQEPDALRRQRRYHDVLRAIDGAKKTLRPAPTTPPKLETFKLSPGSKLTAPTPKPAKAKR